MFLFLAIYQPSSISSSPSSSSLTENTGPTSLVVDGQRSENELTASRKSTLVNDEVVVVDTEPSNEDKTGGSGGGYNTEVAIVISDTVANEHNSDRIEVDNDDDSTSLQANADNDMDSTEKSQLSLSPSINRPRMTPPFTLRYYLLLLRYSIMEQSINLVGQQTLLQLQRQVIKVAATKQPTDKGSFKGIGIPNQPNLHHTVRWSTSTLSSKQLSLQLSSKPLKTTSLNRKLTTSKSSSTVGGGRVVDLRQASCARCHKSILSSFSVLSTSNSQRNSTVTSGHLRPRIKMYRNCEHIFHSSCHLSTAKLSNGSLTGRCGLCSRNNSNNNGTKF